MYAVDKDIEVPAEITLRIDKMELYRWIPLDNILDHLSDGHARDMKFALVIDVIFHHIGKMHVRHSINFTP